MLGEQLGDRAPALRPSDDRVDIGIEPATN
jgi:hypothetical protein